MHINNPVRAEARRKKSLRSVSSAALERLLAGKEFVRKTRRVCLMLFGRPSANKLEHHHTLYGADCRTYAGEAGYNQLSACRHEGQPFYLYYAIIIEHVGRWHVFICNL